MRYQFVEKNQRSYNKRYTGNFVKPVYKFYRYFIPLLIGIKSFGGIQSELHDQYRQEHHSYL